MYTDFNHFLLLQQEMCDARGEHDGSTVMQGQ